MKRAAISALVFLLLAPDRALAGDRLEDVANATMADSLSADARALMKTGRYAEACPKLEESLRLAPAPSTEFNLADCNEHIGKLATAWAGFVSVGAKKRALALEPRLPMVLVDVPSAPYGLEVQRDGVVIPATEWGTALLVDPGPHRVTATAPGKRRWSTVVQGVEGKITEVEVPRELEVASVDGSLEEATAEAAAAATSEADDLPATMASMDAVTGAHSPRPIVADLGSTRRAIGWVVAGVGAVGLGVGASFGLASLSDRDDSRSHCSGNVCDPAGRALRDDAIRNGDIATVSVIAGGAALVAGLVIMLTAPKRAETRVGQRSAGLVLQAAFQ